LAVDLEQTLPSYGELAEKVGRNFQPSEWLLVIVSIRWSAAISAGKLRRIT
jgi:hypothetical protein